MSIAFYAPMKPPGHPTPSGDRRMARLLMQALDRAGYPVFLASDWRTYDGKGDPAAQDEMMALAAQEVERIKAVTRPTLWFTYHCYYKAPDLARSCGFGSPWHSLCHRRGEPRQKTPRRTVGRIRTGRRVCDRRRRHLVCDDRS